MSGSLYFENMAVKQKGYLFAKITFYVSLNFMYDNEKLAALVQFGINP